MRANKSNINEFLSWLTSGNVRSFRILPHQPGEDVTVRWVSSLDPENPEEVTHLSRTGDNLVQILEWIPTYEKNVVNDTQDKAPEFIHKGKRLNEFGVKELKALRVPVEKGVARWGDKIYSEREI